MFQLVFSLGVQSIVLDCGLWLFVEVVLFLFFFSLGCVSIGENVLDVVFIWLGLFKILGDGVFEELGFGRSGDIEEFLNLQENVVVQSSLGFGEVVVVVVEVQGGEQVYLVGLVG